MNLKNKKAQEEMVGFGLIIIIVSIILLVFISFALTRPSKTQAESYEVESFLQAVLQYTSECESYLGNLSVEKLIYSCKKNEFCLNEKPACEVLRNTLYEIIDNSWKIENTMFSAYELKIFSENEELMSFSKGNKINNFKGTIQKLPKNVEITMNVYYSSE